MTRLTFIILWRLIGSLGVNEMTGKTVFTCELSQGDLGIFFFCFGVFEEALSVIVSGSR